MTIASRSADRLAARILLGLVIGLAIGGIIRFMAGADPGAAEKARWLADQILDPLGQVFLRLLFFVVVPLIFSSLALGIVQLGRLDRLGPLAGRTFALFGLNMAVGVALGLLMMNLLKPGQRLDADTRSRIEQQFAKDAEKQQSRAGDVRAELSKGVLPWLVDTFMPLNLLQAIVGSQRGRIGDVLPLILFALLIGAAGTGLGDSNRAALRQQLEVIIELMTRLVGWALQLAPFAVAAMMASTTISLGLQYLGALGWFTGGVLLVMSVHLFGTMSLLLRLFSHRRPRDFFRAIRVILITAFSTSSSNATLPTTIQITRDKLGVSASTAGFVLPLGATMNMSGTALYEGCVVLFISQVYGVQLTLAQQATLLLLSVLSAVAVAGIPGGALPMIVGLLANFGIPPEGIMLILGVERLLDMARTVLNVAADVVTACIVDERVNPPCVRTDQS